MSDANASALGAGDDYEKAAETSVAEDRPALQCEALALVRKYADPIATLTELLFK